MVLFELKAEIRRTAKDTTNEASGVPSLIWGTNVIVEMNCQEHRTMFKTTIPRTASSNLDFWHWIKL